MDGQPPCGGSTPAGAPREQANASQWNASLDIPWHAALGLQDELEDATCEIFTWLLQQELAAHHVPSSWLPRINPAFLEVKLFLSGKVMDEARHAEVCIKRLWLNGHGPSATGPATDRLLVPLTQLDDYEQASLLVDILGEGQILDIFKIVHDLAPDEATRRIVLLSRRDEARHVSYGVARLRHRLETARDPEAVGNQVVQWIADRIEVSDESSSCPRTSSAHWPHLVTKRASMAAHALVSSPTSPTDSARDGSMLPAYPPEHSEKSDNCSAVLAREVDVRV